MTEKEIREFNYPMWQRPVCRDKCDCEKCADRIKIMKKDREIYFLCYFTDFEF